MRDLRLQACLCRMTRRQSTEMAIAMQMRMMPKLSQAPAPLPGNVIGNDREVAVGEGQGLWGEEEKSNEFQPQNEPRRLSRHSSQATPRRPERALTTAVPA